MKLVRIIPLRSLIGALLVSILLPACSAGFYKRQLLLEDDRVAIYSLPADAYPSDDEIQAELPPLVEPPRFSKEKLVDLLGNLQFTRQNLWGARKSYVFYEKELQHLAYLLSQVMENARPGERLVVISRFDPDQSVVSRAERVTAILWSDEEGFNVVLGEIREEIPREELVENDEAWKEILPVSLNRNYPDLALSKSDDYSLKKIKGYNHETWAVFDPSQVETARFKSRSRAQEKKKNPVIVSPVERLRRLKTAYEEGLLSETEYQKKRAEILDDL